jgi:hypothetical protein
MDCETGCRRPLAADQIPSSAGMTFERKRSRKIWISACSGVESTRGLFALLCRRTNEEDLERTILDWDHRVPNPIALAEHFGSPPRESNLDRFKKSRAAAIVGEERIARLWCDARFAYQSESASFAA